MHVPNINDLYKKHMSDIAQVIKERKVANDKYDERIKESRTAIDMIEITLGIKFCRSCDATGEIKTEDDPDSKSIKRMTCSCCQGYGFIHQQFGR